MVIYNICVYNTYNGGDTYMNKFVAFNNRQHWDIESEDEMADMIKTTSRLFYDKQVLMISSDSLIYVFDNIKEAIDYINMRVKTIDFVGKFVDAHIGNMTSKDIYLHIQTNIESYTVKTLDSYRYEK